MPGTHAKSVRKRWVESSGHMADFGRTRLMGVAVKRFLAKVNQYDTKGYRSLDETLRQRSAPSVHHLFGDTGKDKASRHLLRQQVAEDMLALIQRFEENPLHKNRSTYKAMKRVFYEQCTVQEDKVTVKAKPGGDIIQNPSDSDATRDGHKGSGYQAQLSETCNPENEVQLITCALPQTAVESDPKALEPVLDELRESNVLPEQLLVDASYSSDENVEKSANEYGVELVGPVPSGSVTDEQAYGLKVTGWNILRASVCAKMREIVYQRANMTVLRANAVRILAILDRNSHLESPVLTFDRLRGDFTTIHLLATAA